MDEKLQSILDELKEKYPSIYEGFSHIELEQFLLFAKKHLDYGMGNIAAGTQLSTPDEVNFALGGLWYRISDKVNRWKNIMIEGKTNHVEEETLLDTFQDIANYAMIAQLVARGMWKK